MTEQSTKAINRYDDKIWSLPNGNFHRENGPAIVYANGTKKWFINDELHREDGPAIEWNDGGKEWWIKGNLIYREDPNG